MSIIYPDPIYPVPGQSLFAQPYFLVDLGGHPIQWNNPIGVALQDGSGTGTQIANLDGIVLIPSAAQTANTTSTLMANYNYRGVLVFITPGAFGASESTMTVTIQGYDPVSQAYYTVLASASLTASTAAQLLVYPGCVASANAVANAPLPAHWRVAAAATNWGTGGSTLGVSCALLI